MIIPNRILFAGYSLSILLVTLSGYLLPTSVQAQVAGDATVGTQVNGQLTNPCIGGLCTIKGGTVAGGNLFHSFSRFSVLTGGEARFDTTGLTGIQNIISRVTGGALSNIDGQLSVVGASSGANLFLINPSGILFGPNASLNLGGSFTASTANSLIFADGSQFSAVAPTSSPLLTVSAPIGLQYGPNPGSIQVQGPGNNLSFDASGAFDHSQPSPSGALSVQPGKTLALIGGPVSIMGGNLIAPSGRVEVGSVGNTGTVAITPSASGWSFDYQGVNSFGDIALSQAALLDASGSTGGAIQVQGQNVRINNGSLIISDTLGSGTGEPITIRAAATLKLSGFDPNNLVTSSIITDTNPNATGRGGNLTVIAGSVQVIDGGSIATTTFGAGTAGSLTVQAPNIEVRGSAFVGYESLSSISTFVLPGATGNGGDLTLQAQHLSIADGGVVSTNTFDVGNAGKLTVQATEIALSGQSPLDGSSSGLFSTVFLGATGHGGNMAVNTEQLQVTGGANLSTSTFGIGDAGTLTLNATNIQLTGASIDGNASGLFAQVGRRATGNGGTVVINTQSLQATQGGTVSVNTLGRGNAGTLTVNAQTIQLAGTSDQGNPSGLFAQVKAGAKGTGGNLTVTAQNLQISDGATISASTFSSGNAGTLSIKATDATLSGTSTQGNPSGITAQVETGATGNGGNLTVETDRLQLFNGAQIGSTTFSSGNAGNLAVRSGTILLEGTSASTRSGLFASAIAGTGNGGNLSVAADQLSIQNGAAIGVSNFQSQNLLPPGKGAAGNIQVDVRSLALDQGGRIVADSAGGSRGNITLHASDLILMRHGSLVSTNAQGSATGGNITLNTPFLVAPALENSDITANSVNNRGGRVIVNVNSLFGIEFRPQLTPKSDITASSALGAEFNGTVQVNALNLDPTHGLVHLPTVLIDPNTRIAAACEVSKGNTFVVTGRGGLPQDATQPLTSSSVWSDLRLPATAANSTPIADKRSARSSDSVVPVTNASIVEVSGWVRNSQGQIFLVANDSHAREGDFSQLQCEKLISPQY
ncbi:MAG: filamentous hemagglutinin N-terminal domain-containing protein [Leptolyngbya sp. BL-A-14]